MAYWNETDVAGLQGFVGLLVLTTTSGALEVVLANDPGCECANSETADSAMRSNIPDDSELAVLERAAVAGKFTESIPGVAPLALWLAASMPGVPAAVAGKFAGSGVAALAFRSAVSIPGVALAFRFAVGMSGVFAALAGAAVAG